MRTVHATFGGGGTYAPIHSVPLLTELAASPAIPSQVSETTFRVIAETLLTNPFSQDSVLNYKQQSTLST